MVRTSDGSRNDQRSDGWMQAMGQGTIEGTMVQRAIVGAMDQ